MVPWILVNPVAKAHCRICGWVNCARVDIAVRGDIGWVRTLVPIDRSLKDAVVVVIPVKVVENAVVVVV